MVAVSHATQAHAAPHNRLFINRLGIWLFFTGETFLFGAIISTRYYLLGFQIDEHVDQFLGLAITVILLLSSLTAYLAETAASNGDHSRFRLNMMFTMILGLVFMAGVGFEWFEAFQHFPPSTAFGTVFFTTTGIHATHVLSGIILLGIVYFLGRRPERYTQGNYWGVEGSVKYWHFVDVAWVFIYPTLYLVG